LLVTLLIDIVWYFYFDLGGSYSLFLRQSKETSFREKLRLILKATRQHARNLALFAFSYKSVMYITKSLRDGKEESYDSLVAGLLGGYYVFGRGIQSSVNQQIVIYIFGRVVLGLAKLLVQQSMVPTDVGISMKKNAWPIFAATSWGIVMWLFRWHPDTLQPSLRSSMTYMFVFFPPYWID
jgi:hypothetical protein